MTISKQLEKVIRDNFPGQHNARVRKEIRGRVVDGLDPIDLKSKIAFSINGIESLKAVQKVFAAGTKSSMQEVIDAMDTMPDAKAILPCEHCGHTCRTDAICPKCGGDPMLPADRLCADCDAVEREEVSRLADEYNADDFARDYPNGDPLNRG